MSALEPGEPPWGFRKPPRSPHVCPGSSTAALGVLDAAQGVPTSALGARVPPWGSLMPPGGPHVYLGASSLALGVPDAAWGSSRLPWRLEFPRGRPGSHPGVTASNLGGWSPTLGVPDVAEESPRLLLGLETCSGGSRTPPRLWRRLPFRTGEAPGSRRSPLCPHRPFSGDAGPGTEAGSTRERQVPEGVSVGTRPVHEQPYVSPGNRTPGRSGHEPTAAIHTLL
nr:uncharacterized protein LOC129476687 [Symphalangus syndactylus]